ncbi:MAG TPA: hypothetical protein VHV49_00050, partial [Pseudonocardiaceae bacterium]|nr:hypothetical protein [Pseudonocardiaceae bacterium]
MRTVRSAMGLAAVVLAVAGSAGACARTVSGSAAAVPGAKPDVSVAPPSSGSQPPSGGNLSQAAQQACARLPKDAVTTAFGVTGVTVTADSGVTLAGGIQQIKCVIDAKGGFRANVVVQVYPP